MWLKWLQWTWLVVALMVLGTVLVASAQPPTFTPRGEALDRPGDSDETALAKLAAKMKPGSWAELETEMPDGLWSSPKVDDRGGLHIAGWTDDGHWDSRTRHFLYLGLRQTRQFIAYDEEANAWRVIPLDRESDNPVFRTQYGHVYGTNAFDPQRSRFYHLHRDYKDLTGGILYFDVTSEKWTKLPPQD